MAAIKEEFLPIGRKSRQRKSSSCSVSAVNRFPHFLNLNIESVCLFICFIVMTTFPAIIVVLEGLISKLWSIPFWFYCRNIFFPIFDISDTIWHIMVKLWEVCYSHKNGNTGAGIVFTYHWDVKGETAPPASPSARLPTYRPISVTFPENMLWYIVNLLRLFMMRSSQNTSTVWEEYQIPELLCFTKLLLTWRTSSSYFPFQGENTDCVTPGKINWPILWSLCPYASMLPLYSLFFCRFFKSLFV